MTLRCECSPPNVVVTGLMRDLATLALRDVSPIRRAQVAAMTDDEFWSVLRTDPRTAALTDDFRHDPAARQVIESPTGAPDNDNDNDNPGVPDINRLHGEPLLPRSATRRRRLRATGSPRVSGVAHYTTAVVASPSRAPPRDLAG